ncbi:MAG: NAD(P)H-binding protein [Chitinophagaceae bacterium]
MKMLKNETPLTTLVLGGNGKTGRRVVNRLQQQNLSYRIGSRSGIPAFDWNDTSTWKPALQGTDAVYITFQPDLAVPGAKEAIAAFTDVAVQTGVQRLVLLSGRGEEEAQQCEEVVIQAGVDWTIVRCSWFSQNFSESFLLEPVLAGEVILPVGNVGEPFIDAEDIADAVTAALTERGHAGRIYELTGPRLVTFQQAVEEIAKATGRDIEFASVSAATFAGALRNQQVPEDDIAFINYLFTEVLDGRNEKLTDGVQEALHRPAKDFSQYVQEAAATGVWNN